jgi:hypothetical protein
MDEVAAAPVDERAIGMSSQAHRKTNQEAGLAFPDLRLETGIVVHRNTSVYININQVELRLGTNVEVYSGNITLTYS